MGRRVVAHSVSSLLRAFQNALICVLLGSSFAISAQTLSPEVTLGVGWLTAQIQSDGSVVGEGASIARAVQVRAETSLTVKQLTGALPASVATRLLLDADVSTEILSRKILVSLASGGDPGTLLASLTLLQNTDGGFAANSGYQSSALDTAWALKALAAAGRGASSAASAARGYLVGKIGVDGGVTGTSARQNVLDTAYVLAALRAQTSDVTNIELTGGYLKTARGGDGSWQSNDYTTAEVWLALSASVATAADRTLTQSYLKSLQNADGSWGGDPFVTALALRALSVEAAPPTPTLATVTGRIVDAGGLALSGVAITLTAPSGSISATSNVNGDFALRGLGVGQYQLTASKAGYQSAQTSFSLSAGQQLVLAPITLTTVTTSGVIRGIVTNAADGRALAGVTLTLAGSPSRVTTTSATGAYEFVGVLPGAVALSAAKTGFDTVSATATLAAGQILVFSPAMSATGTTPTTPSRITGKVISTATAAALQNVSVLVDGTEILKTPASGAFDFELAAGAHRVSFVIAGYGTLAQDFVLQRNATLSFGNVALSPVRATTRIVGKITQSGGGSLQGALIQIEGGASTASAVDGSYTLDGVTATSVKLTASLATFQPQSVTIALPLPRDVSQDFTLQPAATASLTFGATTVAPNPVSANARVVVTAPLTNSGAAGTATVIVLQVRDSADKVVDRGVPIDIIGQPIGGIDLAASETRTIRAEWNSGRFPPGTYSLVLRAVTPGSLNRSLPDGQLVAETRGSVLITAESKISGTVTANPPVLRVGSSAPIHLAAAVKNAGNTALTAQSYRLTATKNGAATAAYSQQVAASAVALGGVFNLVFPDWTPTEGGNYDLVLTAESAGGSALTTVYVGDTASAVYTVTPNKTPIGTQTVQGKIAVTGQDAVSGRISDPLAPLIKAAITSAVAFNDTETTAWTLRNNCQGCHIQTQGLVGGEVNKRLTTADAFKRATIVNNTSTNLTVAGPFDDSRSRDFPLTMTTLGLWAMSNYSDRDSQAAALRRGAGYVTSVQGASGRWEYDHPTGWVATNYASTAFNLQSLAETHRTLKRVGVNGSTYLAAQPYGLPVAGPSRGFVSQGSDGSLYLSTRSGEVIKRRTDGTTLFTWTGLNDPRRTLQLPDGRLVVTTGNGILELKPDGSTPLLVSVSDAYELVIGKNGKIYSDAWLANTLYEIDPATWAITDWLAGAPGHGLQNPARIYVESDGSFLVTNYGAREIVRFRPDKTFERVTVRTNGNPSALTRYQNKWWVTTTTGLYRYNDLWEGERVGFPSDFAAWGGGSHDEILLLQSGELVSFPYNAYSMQRIAPESVSTVRFADAGQPYQTGYHFSEDTDGTIYFSDRYYGTIRAFSPSGVFTGKTWSPGGNPYKALRLQSGELIVGTTSGLYRLNADGTSTQLIATSEIFDMVQTPDGRILTVSYYNNRIYRIDPLTWTYSDWLEGNYPVPLTNPWHVVAEPDGSVLISNHNANQIVRVKPDKSMQVVASGFAGNPTDMAFFKGKWWVSTTTGVSRYSADWVLEDRVATGLFVDMQLTSSNRLLAVKDQSTEIFEFIDSAAGVQSDINRIATAVDRATTYLMGVESRNSYDSFDLAHHLIGLEAARKFFASTDPTRADAIYAKMEPMGAALRLRQNPDGGYGRYWYAVGHPSNWGSDSLMTAQIGVALDALNPSARSPEVRKAIEWALANQDANGSWYSQNGIFSTREAATTWVAIWLPTMLDRLGGIDTDVTVVNAADSVLSNPRPVPATVETLSTGETRYKWSMQGVTAAGREITFDLSMPDLKPGEKRNASTEAYLTFKNSFTVEDQRAPIDVPAVTASAQVDLGITTDKPAYGANTPVLAPVVLVNDNPAAIGGMLNVVIRDSQGAEVARLRQEPTTLPVNGRLTVNNDWNTGSTLVGRYAAEAELRDAVTGRLLAAGRSVFDIISTVSVLVGTVATDKAVYQSREQVIITGRAYNRAANVILNNYRVEERVLAPDNSVIFSASRAIQQIVPGSFVEMRFPWRLNNAPPETYRVEQRIYDDLGALKDTQNTSFRVQSVVDSGFGLRGSIAVTPKQVRLGETLSITSGVSNSGNADLLNLPLQIGLLDPAQGVVVTTYPVTVASLAAGTSVTLPNRAWVGSGRTGATYVAVLTATLGSAPNTTQLTLATDTFQLLPQIATEIVATNGTPQSAALTKPYTVAIEATVRDTVGNPLANQLVTFAAPVSGASVSFPAGNTATSDASGKTRVVVTANNVTGAFTVLATVPNVAGAARFNLTNTASNAAPSITWVSPPSGTIANAPAAFALTASATDSDGSIAKVEFFSGATRLGVGTRSSANNYVYQWNAVPVGIYRDVMATATDDQGLTASTPPVTLTVQSCGSVSPFTFDAQDGVPITTLITSNAITVRGVNCPAAISVTSGEYSVNGGAFTAAAGTVVLGDVVRLRVLSAADYLQTTSAIVNIGGVITNFNVKTAAKPVLTQQLLREARVLVLISCSESEDQAAGICGPTRKPFVDQYLTSLGLDFFSTTDAAEFQRELRCGRYNVYWVSGGFAKLKGSLDDELIEAVYRGNGLVIDGVHDERNSRIDEAARLSYKGKLPGTTHSVFNATALLPTGSFATVGQVAKLALVGAIPQASFDSAGGSNPAIVTSTYGLGSVITYGFDWVATARAQPSSTIVRDSMARGLGFVVPTVTSDATPGQYLRLRTAVSNPSTAVITVEITAALPSNAIFVSSFPAATSAAGSTIVWRVDVPANGARSIDWSVRAPTADSTAAITTTLARVIGAVVTPIGSTTTALPVRTYVTGSASVRAQVAALAPTQNAERQARDRALGDLDSAASKRAAGAYQAAIYALLDALNELDRITSVPTQAAQLGVDDLLKTISRESCVAGVTPTACTSPGAFTNPIEFGNDGNDNGNVQLLRVRGGGSGSPSTGFGAGQWQAGILVKQSGYENQSLANFSFQKNKTYNWTFEYKGNGHNTFTLSEPNQQSVVITEGSRWGVNGALKFLVHADAGLGNNTMIQSSVLTLNGTALTGGSITTSGNNQLSDVVKVLSGPALQSPFVVTGQLGLFFTGNTAPSGDKLYFQINGGEGECRE